MGCRLQAFGEVFENSALRRLLGAWAVSVTGTFAYVVVLSVIVYRRGGGASGVGLLMLVRMLLAAASPFAAMMADRRSRRGVMIATDLARAVLLGLLAVVASAGGGMVMLYGLACMVAVVATAFRPAQAALTPSLARSPQELTTANAVSTTIESAAIFAGPGAGGLLLAIGNPSVGFAVCAAMLVWSAAMVARVPELARDPAEGVPEPDSGGFRHRATGGIRLGRSPLLGLVVGVYALQAMVAGALGVFTVVLAFQVLHIGNAGVGYLDSAFGVGGVLGGIAAVALAGGRRLALAFALGVVVWGIGIVLVGLAQSIALVCLLLAGVGLGNTVVDVAAITLMQRSAPAEAIGRVFGVMETALIASVGVGSIAAPALISIVGVEAAIVITGLVLPLAVAATAPRILRLDAIPEHASAWVHMLRSLALFAPLPEPTVEQLASHLMLLEVAAGREVTREGDPGERFYLVEQGELDVSVGGQTRAPITAGGFFGEIALLRDTPRTATVTARTYCRLLTLDRSEFLAAITGHADSAAAADLVVSARLGSLRPGVGVI